MHDTTSVSEASQLRARRWAVAPYVVLGVIGVVYAVAVPFGLPYDEPSHWENVLHLADHGSLPRVGDSDVSYEAVQGPLAYVVDALVLLALRLVGLDDGQAEVGVRIVQVLWLLLAYGLLWRVVARLVPDVPMWTARAAGLVTLGTPVLLAIGSSVQNDVPSLALCLATLLALARVLDAGERPVPRAAALAGLLAGLAFLAKASVWPLGVVVVAVLVLRRRSRDAAVVVVVGLVVSAWWLVRNVVLYRSLTGTNAVDAAGYDFPPIGLSADSVLAVGRSVVTFLWIPVEYWRNTISAPLAVEGLVLVLTAVIVVLGAAVLRSRDPFNLTVVALTVLCVVTWVVTTVFVSNASPRLAYPGLLTLWAAIVAVAFARSRLVPVVGFIGVAVLHVWSLTAL